jgi:hypothetical protein
MKSYTLADNWVFLVEDIRAGRIVSQTPSVIWTNGYKHGIEEGSISRDIIAFISRRPNLTATCEAITEALPTAFQSENKPLPVEYAKEYLRELVKMGILDKH